MNKFVKKVENQILKIKEGHLSSNNTTIRKKDFIYDFINTGRKNYEIEVDEDDETYTLKYNSVTDLLQSVAILEAALGASFFIEKKTPENFVKLVQGYHIETLLHVYAYKEKIIIKGVLLTNSSLSFIFSSIFFKERMEEIGQQLIRSIKDAESKGMLKHLKSNFGRDSLLHLVILIAQTNGLLEIAETIKPYCVNINPIYARAIENILSEEVDIILTLVKELTEYRIENSKDDLTLPFNSQIWQFFPIEILAFIYIRNQKGKNCNLNFNEFVDPFIFAMLSNQTIPFNSFATELNNKV